jgi:hypothetical protein
MFLKKSYSFSFNADRAPLLKAAVGLLSMTHRIAFTLLSLALVLICSGRASACWCRHDLEVKLNQAIRQQFRSSSVIFAGEVVEQTVTGLRFRVNSAWKGHVPSEIILTSKNYVLQTPGDVEHFIWDCAFTFTVGKTYLVYAFVDHGQLEVSKCGRTQYLSDATLDMAELDRLSKRRTNATTARFSFAAQPNKIVGRERRRRVSH